MIREWNMLHRKDPIPDESDLQLAACLKARRAAEGMTQTEFASRYKVTPDLYAMWERGYALPPYHEAIALLAMLGNEMRESLNIHLGVILDEIRGIQNEPRARALDALAIVMELASPEDQMRWMKVLEDAAAGYAGIKKRPGSVRKIASRRKTAN